MSNLSVKYDPEQVQVSEQGFAENPEMAAAYLGSGLLPTSMIKISSANVHYRDATLAKLLQQQDSDVLQALKVLTAKLRSIPTNDSEDVKVCCEYVSTLAYALGNVDLVKETLVRLAPKEASSLLKTIYNSIAIKQLPSEVFRGYVVLNEGVSIHEWNMQQQHTLSSLGLV